jgi:hypothetical protein
VSIIRAPGAEIAEMGAQAALDNLNVIEAVSTERALQRVIEMLASLLAQASRHMWHLGDGYGGWVRAVIEAAFDEEGLERPLPPRANPNARKPISNRLRTEVFERDAYRCVECGDYHNLQIDHSFPVSKGGTNHIGNLQTLCRSCNSRKKDSV